LLTGMSEASPRFPENWPLTCYDIGSGGRI
jgi:hypothetical protein